MGILGIFIYIGIIYWGALVAQIEEITFWKALGIALLGWVITILAMIPLAPTLLVPGLQYVIIFVLMAASIAVSSKLILKCEWQPALTIGGFCGIANAIWSLLTAGCNHIVGV